MIRQWLIKLLGIFSRTERSTEEELIEYGRQLERDERKKTEELRVYYDPTVRSYPQSGAYDYQGPITDRPTIVPNPRGRYAQQRWPEFKDTKQMPIIPQPRKLHFHRVWAEPDSTFNAL